MQFHNITRETEQLDLGQLADILEVSEIVHTIDMSNTIVHFIIHPQRGNAIIVNNSSGDTILIPQ